MSDPRKQNLPWPFVAVDEPGFFGVEIAPNEIVYVVLAGDHRSLIREHNELLQEHQKLTLAAYEQLKAAQNVIEAFRSCQP